MHRPKDQKYGGLCTSIFFEKLKIVVKNPEKVNYSYGKVSHDLNKTNDFYNLIREGIRFMQNGTPPFLSNVHVLRPPEPEKMFFTNVSVCVSVDV